MAEFDRETFKENIRSQVEYLTKHESRELFDEVMIELVRERLGELTFEVLNEIAEGMEDVGTSGADRLKDAKLHISPLDIDHRLLVREALKKEMAKSLRKIVDEKIK